MKRLDQVAWLTVSIASPDTILEWSNGEVKKNEAIDAKRLKPFPDGLFCERIFGPEKNWNCYCGKYKKKRYSGIVCEQCGVEITSSRVRRERMGHIKLKVPVSHIWFLKNKPSPIGKILDVSDTKLESVIDFERYIVVNPGATSLKENQILDDAEYAKACETFGTESFVAKMGAEGLRDALSRVNLPEKISQLQKAMAETGNVQNRKKLAQRLLYFNAFQTNNVRPEWMILTVLPVIPPGLRPWVPGEGKRLIFSILNDLYGQVLDQNNKLKELLRFETDEKAINAEKRKLQEFVDALLDENRERNFLTRVTNKKFKSLSDRLMGKNGRFRNNLLGKRVDFSGRSVIMVGPELKLHQCGLPKKIALELFRLFIGRHLLDLGKTEDEVIDIFEHESQEMWEALEEVAKKHPVILNRAPTLHRLSIQAFEPVLIDGDVIRVHPLVCAGFGADFDGDTMSVHMPLSKEAQKETRELIMATNNFLHPANALPAMNPSQEMVLGCYYLTADPRKPMPADLNILPLFSSLGEALMISGYWSVKNPNRGRVKTHDWVRLAIPDFGRATVFGDAGKKIIVTTVGRILFNDIWPTQLGFYNAPVDKKKISEMIFQCYQKCGCEQAIATLDRIKELGFRESTRAGISIGSDDLIIPRDVIEKEIRTARSEAAEIEAKHLDNSIAEEEIKVVWEKCNDAVSKKMMLTLEANQGRSEFNPVWLMVQSGARGNKEQVRQLIGLRGLIAKPDGGIVKKPVLGNYRDGLNVAEYCISCHGVRKGVSDRSRRTADAGYLTRKLVSAAQEVIIGEEDCGTRLGLWVKAIIDDGKANSDKNTAKASIVPLVDRITGRVACEGVLDPREDGQILVQAGQIIDGELAKVIIAAGVDRVKIRSPITCGSRHGICVNCYGQSTTSSIPVKLGEPVGVIAAQSIGEPGTQLTMRTFHTGGTASRGDITGGLQRVTELFEARKPQNAAVISRVDGLVTSITDNNSKQFVQIKTANIEKDERHHVPAGIGLCVAVGDWVTKGQSLSKGMVDPHDIFEVRGLQEFQDYMMREVQPIYSPQVSINCKHIEVIIRQMLALVCVTEPGDTAFAFDQQVDRNEFEAENKRISESGKKIASAKPILSGITKAALRSDSFLSAASFQNTTKILAEAAVLSKRDDLWGIKASAMAGKLIPAGTGFQPIKKRREAD